jgi:sugar phosphate isomerase/epimerase
MFLGYNTNGLAHHDLESAVKLLAELGCQGVAITLDHLALNPFEVDWEANVRQMRELLDHLGMACAIETGARYLLDPRLKHEPTLISPQEQQRARRLDFYERSVDVAALLGARCVSIWSGRRRDEVSEAQATLWLEQGLRDLLAYAHRKGVVIGFEPEPGMFVDTMDRFAPLADSLSDQGLRLSLDVGHLQCQGELPLDDQIRRWGRWLVHVHIEDMRRGEHEHLMFGEGEIDFPPVIAALAEVGYDGGLYIELSRHSHEGPQAAQRALAFLSPLIEPYGTSQR